MVGHKFLHYLERRLSNPKLEEIWLKSNIMPPRPIESYVWWFFLNQKQFFVEIQSEIEKHNSQSFKDNCTSIYIKVEKRVDVILELCGKETINDLYESLSDIKDQIEELKTNAIYSNDSASKYDFLESIDKLGSIHWSLANEALKYTNQN